MPTVGAPHLFLAATSRRSRRAPINAPPAKAPWGAKAALSCCRRAQRWQDRDPRWAIPAAQLRAQGGRQGRERHGRGRGVDAQRRRASGCAWVQGASNLALALPVFIDRLVLRQASQTPSRQHSLHDFQRLSLFNVHGPLASHPFIHLYPHLARHIPIARNTTHTCIIPP